MEGWIRGAQKAPHDAPTPRERISVAEGCLEIGGGAQWGAGIATWFDFSDLESRVDSHLHTVFPHVQPSDALLWSAWKGAFIHTFRMCEPVVGGSGGVRDHAQVRDYEELHSLSAGSRVPVHESMAIVCACIRAAAVVPTFLCA